MKEFLGYSQGGLEKLLALCIEHFKQLEERILEKILPQKCDKCWRGVVTMI